MWRPVVGGRGCFVRFGNRGGLVFLGGLQSFWRDWSEPLRRCSPVTAVPTRR